MGMRWRDLSADEVRKLHRQAREAEQEQIESMTPLERMEEAYRLFRLVHGVEDDEA